MEANDGEIPGEMTLGDVRRMEELQIFEWEEYEREQEKLRLQRIKLENPREITKVAKVKEFWEQELRQGQNRRIKKG
jgi:hypothetical protein